VESEKIYKNNYIERLPVQEKNLYKIGGKNE